MGKDWDAVATAINTRMAELELSQRELAERSGVSVATLRQIQNNYSPKRRSPRLLSAISEALRWPPGRLAEMLEGSAAEHDEEASLREDIEQLRGELRDLRNRVNGIEGREAR